MTLDANAESVLSFRRYLRADISDFVARFKEASLNADLLAEFIIIHSTYQEEGSHLFPAVFIADNLEEILSVTKGSDPIQIGSGGRSRAEIHQAFKRCAPLASDRAWAIFVIFETSSVHFGIFRTDQSPLRPTAFERLRRTNEQGSNVIGLSRLGGGFVEVRTSWGLSRYVNMTGEQEETENPKAVILKFIEFASLDCPPQLRSELRSFYYRVGFDILHSSHGTIVAVIDHQRGVPSIFDDGILLAPRINIVNGISRLLAEKSNEAFQQLTAWNLLLRKMTSMDGITVVDSSGAIVGYNYFIRNSAMEARATPLGGARRRAFDALCSYLGDDLLAVVYNSRDGAVEIGAKK